MRQQYPEWALTTSALFGMVTSSLLALVLTPFTPKVVCHLLLFYSSPFPLFNRSCLSFLSFIRQTLSHLFTDDGNRLYLNYEMIINDWNVHYVKEDTSATFSFTANQIYPIALEYYDATGTASVCSLPLSLSLFPTLLLSPSLPLHSLSLFLCSPKVSLSWSSTCLAKQIIPQSQLYPL